MTSKYLPMKSNSLKTPIKKGIRKYYDNKLDS